MCSTLLHAGLFGALLLMTDKATPPLVGANIITMEIVLQSPDPGGGDGMIQAMQKQEKATPAPSVEPQPVQTQKADLTHDAPASPLGDIALPHKPVAPPRKQSRMQEKLTKYKNQLLQPNDPPSETSTQDNAPRHHVLADLKGETNGRVTASSNQQAGIHKTGLAGQKQAAQYRLGSALNPKPRYPRLARKRGWQGRVILHVDIDHTGSPVNIQIVHSSGYKVLDRAARRAVKKWTFTPAKRAGLNVASQLSVPIRFDLLNS